MRYNILRILLSVFVIFTFLAIFHNSYQNVSDILSCGLCKFSVQSDMSVDEASRLILSEASSSGFDIMTEDYEMIDNEGYVILYKTNNTEDFLPIKTSKGSIRLSDNESFSNVDLNGYSKQYRLLIASNSRIIIRPFEEFCKRGNDVSDYIVYCKSSDKNKVFNSYRDCGFEISEYNDVTGITKADNSMQLVPGMIYLLAVLLCTAYNAKKIVLMRMNGFSIIDITAREITALLPCGMIIFLICFVSSVFYTVFNLRISVLDYLYGGLGCLKTALYIFSIAIISRIVMNIAFCKEKYVKGAVPGNLMYFLISTVKTSSVIVLTASITTLILSGLLPQAEMYRALKKYSNRIQGLVYFSQHKGGIEQCDLSERKFAPRLMDFYHDVVNNYDAILCDTNDYLLDENGKLMCCNNMALGYGPSIEVNGNYLKENEVYDSEDKRVYEKDLDPDCLTVLIPDDYKWDRELLVGYEDKKYYPDINIVFKEYDAQKSKLYVYLNNGTGSNGGLISPAPAIFIINDYALENDMHIKYHLLSDVLYGRVMLRTHTDNPTEELTPLFRKYDCEDIIDGVVPLENALEASIDASWNGIVSAALVLVAFLFVVLLTTVFTADFYCRNHRRQIAARALSGYSFFATFRLHGLILIAEYVVVIIVVSIRASDFAMPGLALGIAVTMIVTDLLINFLRCRIQLKKNVYQISKGEM